MNMKILVKYKKLWGGLIAAVLLFFSFHDLDAQKIADILSRSNFLYLIPATALAFLANFFKAVRWRIIVDPVKPISVRNIVSVFSVGQMANVSLPALTGQAARIVLLARQSGLAKTYCATTVVLEVLFDGMSLLVLLLASSTVVVFPWWLAKSGVLAATMLVTLLTSLLLIVHNRRRIRIYGHRRIKFKYPKFFERVKNVSRSFADALDMLKSTRHTLLTSLYSAAHWLSHGGVIYFIMLALGINLTPGAALVVLTVNALLLMFPITPGNLGTFQWACVVSMTTIFGIPKESSISFSVVLHLLDMLPIYIAGSTSLVIDRLEFKDIKRAVEEVDCPEPATSDVAEPAQTQPEVSADEEASMVRMSRADDNPP